MRWTLAGGVAALAAVAAHDVLQKRHSILRNFPVIGHGRYAVEKSRTFSKRCSKTTRLDETF